MGNPTVKQLNVADLLQDLEGRSKSGQNVITRGNKFDIKLKYDKIILPNGKYLDTCESNEVNWRMAASC